MSIRRIISNIFIMMNSHPRLKMAYEDIFKGPAQPCFDAQASSTICAPHKTDNIRESYFKEVFEGPVY